jgi:hypothetical protein
MMGMFIFFKGWGFLVPLIAILCPLGMVAGIAALSGDWVSPYSKWLILATCWGTGLILWYTGRWFNRNDPKWVKLEDPSEDRFVFATGGSRDQRRTQQ